MAHIKTLKLTNAMRQDNAETMEQRLRRRLIERLGEQLEMAKAELEGADYRKTRRIYITAEDGTRT